MPSVTLGAPSGRYLSFAEREEIALLRAERCGVRAIARRLGRSSSTISVWLARYNTTRPHGALSHQAPISRLRQLTGNNLLGFYT